MDQFNGGGSTFERNQQRLIETAKAPYRKDLNADFVLRGAVACADCGGALTACWSKSKTGKLHPYYLCHTRGCASARKSIQREKIEGEFEAQLRSLQPTPMLFDLVGAMFRNAWNQRREQLAGSRLALKKELKDVEGQTDKLLERIIESDSPAVRAAYERKIAELETRKLLLAERLNQTGRPQHAYEDMFELAMRFLSSPWNIWASGQFALRRMVLRLAFAERIAYSRENGFSNPKISLPLKC